MTHKHPSPRRGLLSKFGLASALTASLVLTGCGSGSDADKNKAISSQILSVFKGKRGAAPARVTQEQILQVAANTAVPLVVVDIEQNKTSAILIEIGRNGPIQTYATSARQTVSLQNGLARGSRGLGGDLMSVDLGALPHLVASKGSGVVNREIRVLSGEDVTQRYKFSCSVSTTRVSTKPAAYDMTESCAQSNGTARFTNTYRIDHAGRVESSRQWFGPHLGYISIQQVRH